MEQKLIRTANPFDGLEVTLWEVQGGYSVSVDTDEVKGFDADGTVFPTLEEAEEMFVMTPYLIANAPRMLEWITFYEGSEELPNIYDLEKYEDVVLHIIERHGEEGRQILEDPDHAPAMWHEVRHVEGPKLDHSHKNTNPIELAIRMDNLTKMINNPLFGEFMKLDSTKEELTEASAQLNEIYSRNGIKFDE